MATRADHLLIAIDVGNSRIKLGLFEQNGGEPFNGILPACLRSMAVEVDAAIPWENVAGWANHNPSAFRSVILGGANPRGCDKVLDGWPNTGWPDPVVVDNPFDLPLAINVDSPRSVGMDRLLNAVAGNVIRPPGRAMIIVDSGTATTVDVVSEEGAFLGGAILPGFQLGARALHQYTALLPQITNQELAEQTPLALGADTRSALRSGLFWGQLGAVRELLRQLREQVASEPVAVVTGGAGRLLVPQLPSDVIHEPFLALQGLVIVGAQSGV